MNPRARIALAASSLLLFSALAQATVPLYRNGANFSLDLDVRIQLQYYHLGSDSWSEQKLFFRRLRPTLGAKISPSWEAEAEFDFGDAVEGEAIEFKDLFATYLGLDSKGLLLTVGNTKPVFSRQFQSSSKSLTLVDRGFVGTDDFGTVDRMLGARVDGRDPSNRVQLAASLGLASHEPDDAKMEFESPLNASEVANRGLVLAGRVDFEPLGEVEFDQGDFGTPELRLAVSAAAYRWARDGSDGPRSGLAELARARGIELSGAVRGRGLSADAEIHWIRGESADPAYFGGIYQAGEANLGKLSLQSGYLVYRDRLELVGGFDRLNAETYGAAWKRIAMGATAYFKQHRLKVQVNYLLHFAYFGVRDDDPQAIVTQLQILF